MAAGRSAGSTLMGRTAGVIGFGHVGQDVARTLGHLGCSVLAHDVRFPETPPASVEYTSLEDLLRRSDIVTLHVSLNPETSNLIDAPRLAVMKSSAILINTARGGLVDEGALLAAMQDGRLAGAGLDTFAQEPPGDSPLLHLPNVLATPHIGGSTEEAVLTMGRAAIAGLTD